MAKFLWPSVGLYCLFGVFVFAQQLHLKHYRGASQSLPTALSLSSIVGTLVGFAYVGYYAWTVSWWAALVTFLGAAVVGGLLSIVIEKAIGPLALSLSGFVGWPACAYFMFSTLRS